MPKQISVDVNKTVDEILENISLGSLYHILIKNKTGGHLERVGAYNDLQNYWPLGDIGVDEGVLQGFEGTIRSGSFSFAANYQTSDGKCFQFVAHSPTIGGRKIGLTAINERGNEAAKKAWDKRNDDKAKAVNNVPYEARAFITKKDKAVIWVYEVSKIA